MKLFDILLTSPAIQMFGWALLHSLWQGLILASLLKGALSLSKRVSSNVRYLIGCVTLLLMLLLPVSTVLWSNSVPPPPPIPQQQSVAPPSREGHVTVPLEEATSSETPSRIILSETDSSYKSWMHRAEKDFMPWVVLVWSFGVFISSLRLLGIWTYTQRLKLIEKHMVLEQWAETLQKLSRQLRVSRPVVLLESSLVKVPTVIGWLKPMILIPSCALTGLTPQQFELILAHELAHIRRHDYLVNLFQTIIETLLFYHPAAWWVSGQIRNERENACDDLAVSVSGDAVIYARTLMEMERL